MCYVLCITYYIMPVKAQWMYQVQDGYEAYPAEINAIIEQAYRKKSRIADWEEQDDERFMVDFVKMVEQKVGDVSNMLKVKRITPGKSYILVIINM